FGEDIGNKDILKNALESYSPILSISNGRIGLKDDRTNEELTKYIEVDVTVDRNNKEYFFDLFPLPSDAANTPQRFDERPYGNHPNLSLINQILDTPNLTQTEKQQIISARIGQGIFRRNLIADCGYCPITLVDDTNLLIASHIKPWRKSNNEDRINHKNGILLTPTYDKLFD